MTLPRLEPPFAGPRPLPFTIRPEAGPIGKLCNMFETGLPAFAYPNALTVMLAVKNQTCTGQANSCLILAG